MTPSERRKQENAAVLARMKNRDDKLAVIDQAATWWPPRPVIKKDAREIARVYGGTTDG